MSNRLAQYTILLNDRVTQQLVQTENQALRVDKAMQGLRSTLTAFGVGFGLHSLFSGAKDAISDVADLETGLLRVKNASNDIKLGIANQLFINKEVDTFKLKLQESVDAYGSFLFKIKNAGLNENSIQRMYDNILTIGKVAALPQGEIDATVRNIGIMLGEGVLEARHLRGLSYVHPQIVPFLAEAMGLKDNQKDAFSKILKDDSDDRTAMQKLSLLMSGGKLTKMAISSKVILDALEAYRLSVEGKLPETLNTIESATNELDAAWLRLKSTIVMDLKPEILDLFRNLEEGIHWLKEHKEQVESTIGLLIHLGALYIETKIALGLLNTATGIYNAFMLGLNGNIANTTASTIANTAATGAQTAATTAQTAAIWEEVEAFTILNAEMAAAQSSMTYYNVNAGIGGISNAGMLGGRMRRGLPGGGENLPVVWTGAESWERGAAGRMATGSAITEAEMVGGAGAAGALGSATLVGGALLVAIATASIIAIADAISGKKSGEPKGVSGGAFYDGNFRSGVADMHWESDPNYYKWNEKTGKYDFPGGHFVKNKTWDETHLMYDPLHPQETTLEKTARMLAEKEEASHNTPKKTGSYAGYIPTAHNIRGNSVNNFNIHIDNMIRQFNVNTTTVKEGLTQIKTAVTQVLTDAVNDSQLLKSGK